MGTKSSDFLKNGEIKVIGKGNLKTVI